MQTLGGFGGQRGRCNCGRHGRTEEDSPNDPGKVSANPEEGVAAGEIGGSRAKLPIRFRQEGRCRTAPVSKTKDPGNVLALVRERDQLDGHDAAVAQAVGGSADAEVTLDPVQNEREHYP